MAAVPYLDELGISHLYLSPLFKARSQSLHGYDVVDHGQINPEIGTLEDFQALARSLAARGMGLVLDIVPNHMAVMNEDNLWWQDVLENGPAAEHAAYFDIDWRPSRSTMRNRLLVPVLGAPFGEVLEQGELTVEFAPTAGSFSVRYHEHRFPLDPREYPRIFAGSRLTFGERWPADHPDRQDLESLLEAFAALPATDDLASGQREIRYRDKEVHKRRLARLCERSPAVAAFIDEALRVLNGRAGDARSVDGLAALLEAQPYRLALWRVSGDEINYRRFFDVDQLAALRVEDLAVFEDTHRLVIDLVAAGQVAGLRVDHADGLHDPEAYFARLRQAAPVPYVVAEKILAAHERLPEGWSVEGTTGYEFGALTTEWLTYGAAEPALDRIYRRYTGESADFDEIVYAAKVQAMRTTLSAEVTVLAGQLDRIAQADRHTADFTLRALREAIVEVIANFPVYRTYVSARGLRDEDRQTILWAVNRARARQRTAERTVFDFLRQVLLGELGSERAEAALQFTMKFQQVTSPVMAKGVEDTAFYRYNRLVSGNEVGADPRRLGVSTAGLHQANRERARRWPGNLLATSTHDTKRSEDVRHRICVLSELTQGWEEGLRRWKRLHRLRRGMEGRALRNDEYLLFQTLLGLWPATGADGQLESLRARLREYAVKAAREAKRGTSWIEVDDAYEAMLRNFVDELLAESPSRFEGYFGALLAPVAFYGLMNTLVAVTLKLTSPGVPDLYQGNEGLVLAVVDPDNRGVVDFAAQAAATAATCAQPVLATLLGRWQDGELKRFVTVRLLALRRRLAAVFARGSYLPAEVMGACGEHLCAYGRAEGDSAVLVICARWLATLEPGLQLPSAERWRDTRVILPADLAPGRYRDVLSGESVDVPPEREVSVARVLAHLPVAVLEPTGRS